MHTQTQEDDYIKQITEQDKTIENTLDRVHKILDAVTNHHGQVQKSAEILKETFPPLHTRLKNYFDLQEHHGILQDLVKEYPRLQPFVDSVYAGDNHILETCNNLCQEISQFTNESSLDDMNHFYDNYKVFMVELRELKNKINNIVLDSCNLDIGGPD